MTNLYEILFDVSSVARCDICGSINVYIKTRLRVNDTFISSSPLIINIEIGRSNPLINP